MSIESLTTLDSFDKQHLSNYVDNHFRDEGRDAFEEFATAILSDAENVEYYSREGWPKLLDLFYRET